jgi:hypothetical protein
MSELHPVNYLNQAQLRTLNKLAAKYYPKDKGELFTVVSEYANQQIGYELAVVPKTPAELHILLNSPEFKHEFYLASNHFNEELNLSFLRIFSLKRIKATAGFTFKGVVPRNDEFMATLSTSAAGVHND